MTVERTEPPYFADDERTMLNSWLDYHRATLAMKCDGLDAAQLRERAVPPSSITLLGLVRHMADVERGWFRRTLAGEDAPPIFFSLEDLDGDFDNVDDADVSEAFTTWHRECDAARKNVAAAESLDVIGTYRTGDQVPLRWIMLHMIEEYARHNGHADLLRERIDGVTGE
jgi:uncharacterized damage-inducible protein DinB